MTATICLVFAPDFAAPIDKPKVRSMDEELNGPLVFVPRARRATKAHYCLHCGKATESESRECSRSSCMSARGDA